MQVFANQKKFYTIPLEGNLNLLRKQDEMFVAKGEIIFWNDSPPEMVQMSI